VKVAKGLLRAVRLHGLCRRIALNAAYASAIDERWRFSERRLLQYLQRLIESDRDHLLYDLIWSEFPRSIQLLINNQYVHPPFRELQRGLLIEAEWQEQFQRSKQVALKAAEWRFQRIDRASDGGYLIDCIGLSELVRGRSAKFLTKLEESIRVLDPAKTELLDDLSDGYLAGQLYIDTALRQTPPVDGRCQPRAMACCASSIRCTSPAVCSPANSKGHFSGSSSPPTPYQGNSKESINRNVAVRVREGRRSTPRSSGRYNPISRQMWAKNDAPRGGPVG
jgi:hypothetical protein